MCVCVRVCDCECMCVNLYVFFLPTHLHRLHSIAKELIVVSIQGKVAKDHSEQSKRGAGKGAGVFFKNLEHVDPLRREQKTHSPCFYGCIQLLNQARNWLAGQVSTLFKVGLLEQLHVSASS